ncbi:hypothetical protein LIER_26501 [Lithospermum erythrorhizon]|uniref:Uncharacterized protein n=1 Tax=Lithospermum erythrorhizon TaxID=34254 RepID=A0AAV3R9U8_LITER
MQSPKTQKEAQRLTRRIAALTRFISRVGTGASNSSNLLRKGKTSNGPLIVSRRTSNHPNCWLGQWLGTSYGSIWWFRKGTPEFVNLIEATEERIWLLYIDGASNSKGSGGRDPLMVPRG